MTASANRRLTIVIGVAVALVVGGVAMLAFDGDDSAANPPIPTTAVGDLPDTNPTVSGDGAPDSSAPTTIAADELDPVTGSTASTTSPPPPPTSAADTTPGTLVEVTVGTVEVRDPVGLDEVADFGDGLTVEVVELVATEATARTPGEISGPAIRVDVAATNHSAASIDLSHAQLEVTYGPERTPSIAIVDPDLQPLDDVLDAGSTVTGSYLAVVPLDQRSVIQISLRYSVDAPVVVFEGAGPT